MCASAGYALFRQDHLIVEVEVRPAAPDVGESLDEQGRAQTCVDLLCDAIVRI